MIENDRLDEARAMIGKLACGCGVEGFGATASLLADAMKEAGADPAKAMKASLEADAETFPSLAPLAKAVGKGDSSGAVELAWKIENDVNEVPSLRNDFGESISKGSVIGIAKGHMESDADGGFEKTGSRRWPNPSFFARRRKRRKARGLTQSWSGPIPSSNRPMARKTFPNGRMSAVRRQRKENEAKGRHQ
jgi:hypothetical protein